MKSRFSPPKRRRAGKSIPQTTVSRLVCACSIKKTNECEQFWTFKKQNSALVKTDQVLEGGKSSI
jgi:hypothetical protein